MEVGDRVIVAGQRKGTIRYIGETQFAPGGLIQPAPFSSLSLSFQALVKPP